MGDTEEEGEPPVRVYPGENKYQDDDIKTSTSNLLLNVKMSASLEG